jgi:kinetochore protein Nuf2
LLDCELKEEMAQQGGNRRASTTILTFPILSFKDITDLLHNALGLNITLQEASNPTPIIVARVYNSLLDLVTGVSRKEVSDIVQRALENMDYPEMFRDAMQQLTLLREMEELCRASLYPEFKLEDLVNPSGERFRKILSAILNFGRFREDVFRQHAEQTEGLVKMEKELNTLKECEDDLQTSVRAVRERLAKEAPERQRLLMEKEREEAIFKTLNVEKAALQKACEDDKKRITEIKSKSDSIVFDINKIENEISDIRSQVVSSPERIQADLQQLKNRLEQEREELERLREEKRKQLLKKEELRRATSALDECITAVDNAEEKAEQATKEEEKTRSRKTTIESHSYHVKELRQREQESLREAKLADERNNRMNAQRTQKIKQAKDQLKEIVREQENRERHASEDIRKASRLRAEAASLRAQIEKTRVEHEQAQAARQSLFGDVLAAFDAFTQGVVEGVDAVEVSCSRSSVN